MGYLGGKTRLAKRIAATILANAGDASAYYEPMVGGGSVAKAVHAAGWSKPMFLSDAHPDLMLMYDALKRGWVPPPVTIDDYNTLRKAEPSALRGFVGFGASFGGRFFQGFARGNSKDYAAEHARGLERLRPVLGVAALSRSDYRDVRPERSVVYYDPPYVGTKGYSTGRFDHAEFWHTVRAVARDNRVLVSEYVAPEGFCPALEIETRTNLRGAGGQLARTERVFMPCEQITLEVAA